MFNLHCRATMMRDLRSQGKTYLYGSLGEEHAIRARKREADIVLGKKVQVNNRSADLCRKTVVTVVRRTFHKVCTRPASLGHGFREETTTERTYSFRQTFRVTNDYIVADIDNRFTP